MIVKYKEKIGNIKREYKGLLKNKLNFKKVILYVSSKESEKYYTKTNCKTVIRIQPNSSWSSARSNTLLNIDQSNNIFLIFDDDSSLTIRVYEPRVYEQEFTTRVYVKS